MRRVIQPNSFYNHIAALHSSLLQHTRYLPKWVTEEGTVHSPIPCREWNTEICYIYQPHNWRHFRGARDYWGCHGNSTLWRCVWGGASCKTAWNLRPRQAPFTTQTPPLAGVRGPQNQPSEQYRRVKVMFWMAKRVKTQYTKCPPPTNLVSFCFPPATKPGIFRWLFAQLCILCLPPQKCATIMGVEKKQQEGTPGTYIYIRFS